jgi:hypothetical protein
LLRQRHHRRRGAAVTPENVTDAVLANDDRTLLIRRASGVVQVTTLGGGTPADVRNSPGRRSARVDARSPQSSS